MRVLMVMNTMKVSKLITTESKKLSYSKKWIFQMPKYSHIQIFHMNIAIGKLIGIENDDDTDASSVRTDEDITTCFSKGRVDEVPPSHIANTKRQLESK